MEYKKVMIKSWKELEEVTDYIDNAGNLHMTNSKNPFQSGNAFSPKMIHLCNKTVELRDWNGWCGYTPVESNDFGRQWIITLPMTKSIMNRNGANE